MATNTVMGIFSFDHSTITRFKKIVCPLVETHTGLKYVDALSYYEAQVVKIELISRMIRDAQLVIVDISVQKPNVFIEMGIAYALQKPSVFLCSYEAWEKVWELKPPFDMQGRELLLYTDDRDLKVKLGLHISDSLYKTAEVALAWDSISSENHVKGANAIEIWKPGRIWSALDRAVSPNFVLSYHVKIHSIDCAARRGKNPDVRLYLSPGPEQYPCIVVVFPWEASQRDKDKLECIITHFTGTEEGSLTEQDVNEFGPMPEDTKYDGRAQRHFRLQQVAVRQMESSPEYDVFLSCYWPNLVFESTLFEEEVQRLCVSLGNLRARGYPTHLCQYIGFESINSRVSISDISVKEVHV